MLSHGGLRFLCLLPVSTVAFLYRPGAGLTWDPSCLIFEGKTYCYFMYEAAEPFAANETHYGHGFVAVSSDGVHFEDVAAFNAEYGSVGWFKCMVHRAADVNGTATWVMNHGTSGPVSGPDDPGSVLPDNRGCPAGTSQCLRFLQSSDLLSWKYMYTLHPDTRWYASEGDGSSVHATGRWDHAYMQEDSDGFVAFPVATPAAPHGPAPGILRSKDGLDWQVHPPALVHFGNSTPVSLEFGGVERMENGKFYMIGGGNGPVQGATAGYSMWTLRSSNIDGPYAADREAYRLSGQGGWDASGKPHAFGQALATWCRNYDTHPHGALISQYVVMPWTPDCGAQRSLSNDGHVWMLPFRKPLLDAVGHLRLSYWEGNDALRGDALQMQANFSLSSLRGTSVAWIDGSEFWDHTSGIVVTGTLRADGTGHIGIAIGTQKAQRDPATPWDMGPDNDWDRPGNDIDCFSVPHNYTADDCAAACEAEPTCEAWTLITNDDTKSFGVAEGVSEFPCQHGRPLTVPYCTLKAPVPDEMKRSKHATTGLPTRSTDWLRKHNSSGAITTMLLMDVLDAPSPDFGGDGVSNRGISHIVDYDSVSLLESVRDMSGPFDCGGGEKCFPATVTAVSSERELPFVLMLRHGTAELYIGEQLVLVQTWFYGKYPVEVGRLGLVANGTTTLTARSLKAWQMSFRQPGKQPEASLV